MQPGGRFDIATGRVMLAVIGGVFGKVDTEAEPEQLITKAGELDMDEVRASLPAPAGA